LFNNITPTNRKEKTHTCNYPVRDRKLPENTGWIIPNTTHATAMVRLAFPSSLRFLFQSLSQFYPLPKRSESINPLRGWSG
ncbi:MAG: hypothetical protein Q9N34_09270, partial [Aquificota bacterium]|nr:hypothetical protein [Aquificota bacterium]